MAGMSAAERKVLAEQLSSWLRQVVEDERNEVEFHVERGLNRAFADDLESVVIQPNDSATLIVHINGGARASAASEAGPAGEG